MSRKPGFRAFFIPQNPMRILPVFCLFLLSQMAISQKAVTFQGSTENFPNPERGFYHHTETNYSNYGLLEESSLSAYKNEGISIILRILYLPNDAPISQPTLENIQRDFTTMRKAGVKALIRFAYTKKSSAPYGDATPEQVLLHIAQLKPILQANEDVILVLQAGFIGAWGEWYYTDHFAVSPGNLNEQNWVDRKAVVDALLDALPKSRMVQLRTPNFKRTLFERTTPLSETEAFSGSDISRVGHHNDCFAASSTDLGTYTGNMAEEKTYLEQETTYLAMGGETCGVSPPYSDCGPSSGELERFHWSYLNIDYHAGVLSEWGEQGCYDEIEQRLGYRYRLISGEFTGESKPGGDYTIQLKLLNDGYANPYNPREVRFLLKNESHEYLLKTQLEPRNWSIGDTIHISLTSGISSDVEEGEYSLYLHLADPMATLTHRPEYAIRLANENVWDAASGYNLLTEGVIVSTENQSPDYTGDLFFKDPAERTTSIAGSSDFFNTSYNQEVLLYWFHNTNQDHLTRVIEKKNESGLFEPIASLSSTVLYFPDELETDRINEYRYYLTDGANFSPYSDTVAQEPTSETLRFPMIEVNGDLSDWGIIPPVFSSGESVIRVFFSSTKFYALEQGNERLAELLLNVDHSVTGSDYENNLSGYDLLIRNDSLFSFGSSWNFVALLQTTSTEGVKESSIPLVLFEKLDTTLEIHLTGKLLNSETHLRDLLYIRALPSDVVTLEVRNSQEFPESRLVISWARCENCQGYILEKSENNEEWSVLGEYGISGNTTIQDNGLELNKTYFYRIRTFNEIGISNYSDTASETTRVKVDPLSAITEIELSIFPNPTSGQVTIHSEEPIQALWIQDVTGKLVYVSEDQGRTLSINLDHLEGGFYFLKLVGMNGTVTRKLVVY